MPTPATPPRGFPLPEHLQSLFLNYEQVLGKVEQLWRSVEARFPLHCARGCSACCYVDLTVMPVEADFLRAFLRAFLQHRHLEAPPTGSAPPPAALPVPETASGTAHASFARVGRGIHDRHTRFDGLAGPSPCAMLDDAGQCSVYPARPLICRSHGIPVKVASATDFCPLNAGLEAAPALNLDLLNTLLVAVNARYCQETGQEPSARVPLKTLLQEVLTHAPPTHAQEPE